MVRDDMSAAEISAGAGSAAGKGRLVCGTVRPYLSEAAWGQSSPLEAAAPLPDPGGNRIAASCCRTANPYTPWAAPALSGAGAEAAAATAAAGSALRRPQTRPVTGREPRKSLANGSADHWGQGQDFHARGCRS